MVLRNAIAPCVDVCCIIACNASGLSTCKARHRSLAVKFTKVNERERPYSREAREREYIPNSCTLHIPTNPVNVTRRPTSTAHHRTMVHPNTLSYTCDGKATRRSGRTSNTSAAVQQTRDACSPHDTDAWHHTVFIQASQYRQAHVLWKATIVQRASKPMPVRSMPCMKPANVNRRSTSIAHHRTMVDSNARSYI